MNEILMCGTDPVGQLYKDTKAEATSIAPIEISPAESSHNVGTHIMYGGIRYKVTSAISIGDTLTIGTNISAENIEDNLNAENIAYDSNNSVKDMLDNILTKVTITVTTIANSYVSPYGAYGSENLASYYSDYGKLISIKTKSTSTNLTYAMLSNTSDNTLYVYSNQASNVIVELIFSKSVKEV